MKIAIDFENTLTKDEVFDFANDLLNEGVGITVFTSRSGHIKSDHNKDLVKLCRELEISYSNVVFTQDIRGYFSDNQFYGCYLSDNMVNLQLALNWAKCVPLFGNKNWKRDCLELMVSKS